MYVLKSQIYMMELSKSVKVESVDENEANESTPIIVRQHPTLVGTKYAF